jgi:hypothetical protein
MQITITGTTGVLPLQIEVCDVTNSTCVIVTGSTTIPPSFTFDIPSPLDNVTSLLVKITDSNGCEVFQIYSCPTPTPTPTVTPTPTPTPTNICYCIVVQNSGVTDGYFDYIDCNGNQQTNVLVQGGITYYVCGNNPTNEINVTTTINGFCNPNQSCPTPTPSAT